MKQTLILAFLALAAIAQGQNRKERNLEKWQFTRDGNNWQQVDVPHDWAITVHSTLNGIFNIWLFSKTDKPKPLTTLAVRVLYLGLERANIAPLSTFQQTLNTQNYTLMAP